ncbi:MAG: DHA2 family efflux MFS transporter permease subunit [Candidatus Entotheonellia bacterium]
MDQDPRGSQWWPTFGVMLGAVTVSLSYGVLGVAIPSMMSSLSADLERIQWASTAYSIVQAVLIPAVGWLGARLGTKRLFLLSTLIFITGSALCGLAWDVNSLIVFRVLQGIGGGPISPLSMSMLYSIFPPDKRGLAMGLYNFGFSFGQAIAPTLGGHLIEVLSWRAIFYINVPVGLFSLGIVLFTMAKAQDQRARPFDAVGVFSMASFLTLFLLAISEGRRYGWGSQMILTLFAVSGVSLATFVASELKTKQPFVEIRLYKNVPFAMGCVIVFLNTFEFRGSHFLMPIMFQRLFHYTPFQTGLFFLPPALLMGATSILAGRLSDKMQPKLLLILGLVVLTYVSFLFSAIDVWATTGMLLGLIIFRRVAQAFCHSPLTTATLRGIPEDQVRMASGLFSLHRTLAGTVATAVTATLLEHREAVHTDLLSQQQTLYPLGTQVAVETIRGVFARDGNMDGILAQKTAGVLRQMLSAEAGLAAYQDLFFIFAVLTLLSLIPVLLMQGGKARPHAKVAEGE